MSEWKYIFSKITFPVKSSTYKKLKQLKYPCEKGWNTNGYFLASLPGRSEIPIVVRTEKKRWAKERKAKNWIPKDGGKEEKRRNVWAMDRENTKAEKKWLPRESKQNAT